MQMFVCASNQIFVKVISKSLWEISQNGLCSCIDFNIIKDRGIQIRHDIEIAIVKHKNAFIINTDIISKNKHYHDNLFNHRKDFYY